MSSTSIPELQDFRDFIDEQIAQGNGGSDLSPEEALDLWRLKHRSPRQHADDVAAVKAALKDMQNGDTGISFEEFDREFREKNQVPADL